MYMQASLAIYVNVTKLFSSLPTPMMIKLACFLQETFSAKPTTYILILYRLRQVCNLK
jgi:hypothetical protein